MLSYTVLDQTGTKALKTFPSILNSESKSFSVRHLRRDFYRIAFNLYNYSKRSFYLDGSRIEIEWLCNKLGEWSGFKSEL